MKTLKGLMLGAAAGMALQTLVAGVPVGQSTIVGDVMWSDTFTVGTRCPSGYYNANGQGASTRVDSVYMLEHAVGATQWRRPADFSFNTPGDAVADYGGNSAGNDGAVTGFAQSGSGCVAFSGVLPSRVAFQMDARFTCNYAYIATFSTELPYANNCFRVNFHKTGAITITAYGVDTATDLSTGVADANAAWHNYAVVFDRGAQRVEVFVDQNSCGTVDLAQLGIAMKTSDTYLGMGCAGYVAWYDNVQAGVPAAGGSDLALESWRTDRMDVPVASRRAPLVADGTIVKTGAGTLDLGNAAIGRGALDVQEGVVSFDASEDAGLPAQLQSGLAFWVDANVNVMSVGGKVTEWSDRREAAGGTLYPRAVAYGAGEEPTLVDGTGTAAGLKLVDFGTFGQSDAGWLRWVDAEGNRKELAIQTAIFVMTCPKGPGCVLGDWSGTTDDEYAGDAHWRPGLWDGTTSLVGAMLAYQVTTGGEYAYRNDVPCSPTQTGFLDGLTVYARNKGAAYTCSTFCNDRNIRQGAPTATAGTAYAANHQGGGQLGEVLLWTRDLHATEIQMVNAYLMRKWKGGASVGTAHVAKDATLQMTPGTTLGAVTGAGTVSVTGGAGNVRLAASQNPRVTTPFDLAVGTSVTADEDGRVAAYPVAVRTGLSYDVTAAGVAATAGNDVDRAVKTGVGTLVASALPTGTLQVAAGALRLAAHASDEEPQENLVPNSDFEQVVSVAPNMSTPSYLSWGYNAVVADWTLGKGVETGVNATGVTTPNTLLTTSFKTSSGLMSIFVQVDGYAETTFSVSEPGWYQLDFTASKRNNVSSPFGLVDILLDGTKVGRVQVDLLEILTFNLAFPEPLAAGTHTLRFQGVRAPNPDQAGAYYDTMAIIDDVRVTVDRTRLGANLVDNGGFERHDPLTQTTANRPYQPFDYAPTGAGWSFVDPAQPSVTNAGIAMAEGAWTEYQAPEGSCMAFLRQNGYFGQDVTFPEPGRYRLSFVMRGRFLGAKSWMYVGQTFKVFLGETQVAYLQGSTWDPERVTVELPEVDAAHLTQRLSFVGQTTDPTTDATTMFDDIRVERSAGILANPSFEWSGAFANGTWEAGLLNAGWTFDVGENQRNQSGICNRNGPWTQATGVPFGDAAAFLQMKGRISQMITVPTDGVYCVSFSTRRRAQQYSDHDFRVVCDGMALGAVTTRTADDWKRYSFRTPFLKTGVQVKLAFEGLNRGDDVDRASIIDEVALERVADGAEPDADAFAGASVELAEGTVLELDFDGVAELKDLKYAGHSKCGELNAANCPFIRGAGTVSVRSHGFQFILR